MPKKYYIYRHIRLDTDKVFYIGKGCEKRAFNRSNRNTYWKNITNKTDYIIEIMLDNLTKEQALEKEIEMISLYRKFGNLANLTDGGDGCLGTSFPCSEEKKLKISHAARNISNETRLKMSLSKKGKPGNRKGTRLSEEAKANLPKKIVSLETREKQKLAHSDMSAETKQKMSISAKKRNRNYSEETRKKLSDAANKRWGKKCHA